ncbi:MAG: hypothetical protein HY513_02355 [Candidatus Aenigmarchaeota archaeon]|nr:hypothetical protein [Candidatus Aenigmarchaeota archaeon]
MKYGILSILVLLAFTTLCIGAAKVPVNDGLVLKDVVVDPPEIESYSGNINLFASIENVGGTTARNVQATLLGASWLDQAGNRALLQKNIHQLQPYDIRTGAPGELQVVTWNVPPAELPEGVAQDYKLTIRVDYDYSSTAVSNVPIYNEDEYLRRKIKNIALDPITISNTDAPIIVEVVGQPIIVRKVADPNERYFYRIFLINTGSGIPFDQATGKNGIIQGTITLQGDAQFVECFGQPIGGNAVTLPAPGSPNEVLVRRGDSALMPCAIAVNPASWITKPSGTVSFVFDLNYRYFTDADTDVTILGRRHP